MLWGGVVGGALELRRLDGGGVRLSGRFPYNTPAELAPGRFEVIAPRAFAGSITRGANIYLLAGHDFDRPLASQAAGTLDLRDSDDALTFEATIRDGTSWARDFLAAHEAGLVRGLSPGFRVPADGERIDHSDGTLRRTIFAADLVELSGVTRPAYDSAQVEARCWDADKAALNRTVEMCNRAYETPRNVYNRWR